jgi:hypothetical protein
LYTYNILRRDVMYGRFGEFVSVIVVSLELRESLGV